MNPKQDHYKVQHLEREHHEQILGRRNRKPNKEEQELWQLPLQQEKRKNRERRQKET